MRTTVALAALLLLGAPFAAHGGSTTIVPDFEDGKSFWLKDSTNPIRRKARYVSDDFIYSGDFEPLVGGAAVHLASYYTGQHVIWPLPPVNWTLTPNGWKYVDRKNLYGPVRTLVFGKRGMRMSARGAGIDFALLGTGPQQAVSFELTMPQGPWIIAICTMFQGTSVRRDDPVKGVFSAGYAAGFGSWCPF